MSKPVTTTCPHCGATIMVPTADVRRAWYSALGTLSAHKRKDSKEHLAHMARTRWDNKPLSPKEQAILDLARQEDLSKLTLKQIAEKVDITGPWREHYAWRHLRQLKKKGLLSAHKHAL